MIAGGDALAPSRPRGRAPRRRRSRDRSRRPAPPPAGASQRQTLPSEHDIVAVIVHQRRHQRTWAGAARPYGPSIVEAVVGDRRVERRALSPSSPGSARSARSGRSPRPTGCARRPPSPFRADADRTSSGGELLQPDRRGQAGRARADDHDVVFHRFALDLFQGRTPVYLLVWGVFIVGRHTAAQAHPFRTWTRSKTT